jgi:hypothetical protein
MKSFLIAATIALAGTSLIADTAFAKSKRSAAGMGGMGGMAGMAAMAPLLAAGVGMIGSAGYVGGPVVTPYVGPINTYVEPPIVPNVYVPPIYTPSLPAGFGLPGAAREDIGG